MAQLMAKPNKSLFDHTKEVVEQALRLTSELELQCDLREKALLACVAHDLGKGTRGFQASMLGQSPGSVFPHALASFPLALALEVELNRLLGLEELDLLASAAVISHHTSLKGTIFETYRDVPVDYCDELKDFLREDLMDLLRLAGLERLARSFCADVFEKALSPGFRPAELLLGRTKGGSSSLLELMRDLDQRRFSAVKSVLHLADWFASSDEDAAQVISLRVISEAVDRLFEERRFSPRAFQVRSKASGEMKRRRLWLRAPTGTGKTEALLLWAGRTKRFLYLLPTRVATNAMFKRLSSLLGDEVHLYHGMALFEMARERGGLPEEERLDVKLLNRIFARPAVVSTLDQFLLGYLNCLHWEEKRFLSRESTVVIDEVHAYEPYTLGLLSAALEMDPPRALAVASATLPLPLMERLGFDEGRDELVEAEEELWEAKRHRLYLLDDSVSSCVDLIVNQAEAGKSVLAVLNTVRGATSLYEELKRKVQGCGIDIEISLLHSRFAFRDRRDKEDLALSHRKGFVLVATQLVEVSLDISYDVLVTELSPVDALVQRMGRVNRRGELKEGGPVWICLEPSPGSDVVYGSQALEESEAILKTMSLLPSSRELCEAVEALYCRLASSSSWSREFEEGRNNAFFFRSQLGNYTMDLDDERLASLYSTRPGAPSEWVLPASFLDEAYSLRESGEAWRLPEMMVPVPFYLLRGDGFSYSEDLRCWVTSLPYSPETGLDLSQSSPSQVALLD